MMEESKDMSTSVLVPVLNNVDNGTPRLKVEHIEPDTSSDVDVRITGVFPIATCKLPCREDYPGPYNFNVLLNTDTSLKNRWLYSEKLKKLFVGMLSKVSFQFKWIQKEAGLRVRAMLAYCSEDHFKLPVLRCPNHSSANEPSNVGFEHVHHVIRCDHDHAEYHMNPESNRLSVVVPLDMPHPGTDMVSIIYMFVCKNSCTVGMNRRATDLIFTLERANGEVIGRKLMGVRMCSCPKRDKEKEEKDLSTPPHLRRLPRSFQMTLPEFDRRSECEMEPELVIVDSNTDFLMDERTTPENAEDAPSGETENETESDGGEPDTNSNKYLKVRKASFLLPPNKRKVSGTDHPDIGFVHDEFSVFGQHMAMRLRKIKDAKVRLILQHKINDLLFEGEMTNFGGELKL